MQNGVLRAVMFFLYQRAKNPKRILVFRTGSIGDTICAMPAIAAIRSHFKHASIHILTNAGNFHTNLVSMQRLLDPAYYDKLIDYHGYRPKELLKILKDGEYDLVIELPQNEASMLTELRNMFFFRFANIRSGWGWGVHTFFSFRQTQEKWMRFPSETERLLAILKKHQVASRVGGYPLNLRDEDKSMVELLLNHAFREYPSKARLVGLVPGAKRPQNRYPLDRFVALATWLKDKGYAVAVIGGPEDVELGNAIATHPGIISFCGKLTPVQSAILLSKCVITISNDTGPMHLSYAAGTPVIAIFSSRDFPDKWFPPPGNIAIRNESIHCSLCLSEVCSNNICMQGISLSRIQIAFQEFEKNFA